MSVEMSRFAIEADALYAHWCSTWDARHLPWRSDRNLTRKTLVEGLLAQTTARDVADQYVRVFEGIERAADWLRLPANVRRARVAPLGLPSLKDHAVTSLARVLDSGLDTIPEDMVRYLTCEDGIGPYTAGMVALLHGHEAAPVDCNVARVGGRVLDGATAEGWIGGIVAAAMAAPWVCVGQVEHAAPAGYAVISAVLDVGATVCRSVLPECPRCPLRASCDSAERLGRQLILPL